MEALIEYLRTLTAGPISSTTKLESLLAPCWDELEGGTENSMAGYKLHGRMENVHWNPPILKFRIERHGGTALGSTRADIHEWEVNVENGSAECSVVSRRQVKPVAPRLDIVPLAKETAELIFVRSAHRQTCSAQSSCSGCLRHEISAI